MSGALSQVCYYRALEDCYSRFSDKLERFSKAGKTGKCFDADSPDYFVFHAPYNKLVQKSHARLYLIDAKRRVEKMKRESDEEKKSVDQDGVDIENPLAEWLTKPNEETYSDRTLDGVLKKLAAPSFKKRLADSNSASKAIGNTYTASVFMGLASLIDKAGGRGDLTPGKNLVVFSYGSGALATMYRLHV